MSIFFRSLDSWSPAWIAALSLALLAITAWIDSALGPLVSTGIFYVAPVAIGAWYGGRSMGAGVAVTATLTWMATDQWWTTTEDFTFGVNAWNALLRMVLLLLFAYLISTVHSQVRLLRRQAETDSLTGLRNRHAFTTALHREHERLIRLQHPFSLAYIDLDNFKDVNDTKGHAEGDRLLRAVARVLNRRRKTDIYGRLGGDEFAVLLIETDSEAAIAALTDLQRQLKAAMARENWPVTFSIGAVTVRSPAPSVDQVINTADLLMYQVKHRHKNAILHQRWERDAATPPQLVSGSEYGRAS